MKTKIFAGSSMKKDKLVYCVATDTIRQMPQNLLIAYRSNKRWVVDPDTACNKSLAVDVFVLCLDFDNRYGTGQNLINK